MIQGSEVFFLNKNRSLDIVVEYLDRWIDPRFLGRDNENWKNKGVEVFEMIGI